MVTAILAAGLLGPITVDFAPEVRSTYQSLGKIVEDRPMQVLNVRVGYKVCDNVRIGVRTWDVSSLTDRRADDHRHFMYHTEFGPTLTFTVPINDDWKVRSDITRSWTMYRGFDNKNSDKTYHWWQLDQNLANPYVVPFYRVRKCFRGNDYFYFKFGLRKYIEITDSIYIMPSVFVEGGSSRNQVRCFGEKENGGRWRSGISSVSFRLEAGWKFYTDMLAFVYVEQYEVVGNDARSANRDYDYDCAHNDWTHFGIGVRMRF